MASVEVTFTNEVGLHARPAALFTQAASRFAATVQVSKAGAEANAKSLLSLLKLDVRKGDTVTISADGEDADDAVDELAALV
ncbi:MAG TPA: HPr family phosphocarrier protein, partial [Egibacteraceae bacterium]|nr:HPr family phosphocarrier protein [Egibacteraceae bacterium]